MAFNSMLDFGRENDGSLCVVATDFQVAKECGEIIDLNRAERRIPRYVRGMKEKEVRYVVRLCATSGLRH